MRRVRNAWLMDTARVLGDVTLGDDVSLWCGAVVRGDVAPVTIGARSNLQDNVVVHCDSDLPNVIGADVSMGHGAIVHGLSIGDGTLIGMGARVLGETHIGAGCLVAAGCVVPPGLVVPDGMVVMGVPGRIVRPLSAAERTYLAEIPPRYAALARLHAEHPDDPRVRPFGS